MSTRPLIFSNSTSDATIDTVTPPTSYSVGNDNGFQYAPLDGFTNPVDNSPNALPPYEEDTNNITRPQQTSTVIGPGVVSITNCTRASHNWH